MPLRDDLLNPIPGDNPSGVSLRYDPVTDKIKEARREDIDVPQGAWQHALKVADFPQIIKLAGEAVATRSKDLQLAVWLVEAHVRREGFVVLTPCLTFLHGLVEKFWDTLYPEIEDGDMEVRAAPLDWLGGKFEPQLRWLPITASKLSWFKYKESRTVGSEAEAAASDDKKKLRAQLIKDGKISAEEFDQAVDETPKSFYETLQAQLTDSFAALTALGELCDEKFGDQAPSFIKLRTALEDLTQFVRIVINNKGGPTPVAAAAPQPEAVAEQAAPVAAAPVAQAAPRVAAAPPAPVYAAGIDPVSLDDAAARLGAIARFLRKQDVYHIGPYLILRGLRWGEIRYNGPQIDAQMLEAPPPELRQRVKKAALEQKWDEVLEATEAAMELPCGRAWLDIQRYAVQALDNKGQWFAFVSGAIRSSLRALLQDLPGLLDMSLLDDTPVANQETRAWIQEQVLPDSAAGPPMMPVAAPVYEAPPPAPAQVNLSEAPPTVSDDEASPAEPDIFDAALEVACSGRQSEAIDMLFRALASEQTNRARFKRKVQLAHVLIASGREDVAYPILDQLAGEIEQRRLEEWEAGNVIAYPLTLLLQCLKSSNADPDVARQVYARICRLDPVKALECAP